MNKIIDNLTEIDVDKKFNEFLRSCYRCQSDQNQELLKKAYNFSKIAHSGQARYNGDVFINHPLEVARILTHNIGLGTTSAVAALLHDTITNTEVEIEDIKISFGQEISSLVNNLAKIKGTSNFFNINNSEVYKRFLVGISEDIRIIYIKIADRLHNMRTLQSLEPEKKYKVASETMYVYAPLADRLGLYTIKSELEDLAFKYLDPQNYKEIAKQIKDSEFRNILYLNRIALPIISKLRKADFNFEITSRQKSIYSIWQKIKRKGVSFREIYDIFAIRIIFEPKNINSEKQECFEIKNYIEEIYESKKDRVRDWVTTPKPNGYEALHLTIRGINNRWVEIQIRSRRMHDVANYGFASHWAYKGLEFKKIEFDEKIRELKHQLEDIKNNDFDYLANFKLLFSTEIVTYTPKGREIILPVGSTALDFAFYVHSTLGYESIAAKVNNILVPLEHQLQTGDYIYIITSKRHEPKTEWLQIVKTNKAKHALNEFFGINKINEKEQGMQTIFKLLENFEILPTSEIFKTLINNLKVENKHDLYIKTGSGEINNEQIENLLRKISKKKKSNFFRLTSSSKNQDVKTLKDYELAECCNPIPGDEVLGIKKDGKMYIHRKDCNQLTDNNKTDSFALTWLEYKAKAYYTKLEIESENHKGIFFQIAKVLANDLEVNIKSLFFDTIDSKYTTSGWIEIYVLNKHHLKKIIEEISNIEGVMSVNRLLN